MLSKEAVSKRVEHILRCAKDLESMCLDFKKNENPSVYNIDIALLQGQSKLVLLHTKLLNDQLREECDLIINKE